MAVSCWQLAFFYWFVGFTLGLKTYLKEKPIALNCLKQPQS